MRLLIAIPIIALIVAACLVWGGSMVWQQHRLLWTFASVEGKVVTAEPHPVDRGRGRFEPIITYRYRVAGREYVNDTLQPSCDCLTPLTKLGDQAWARQMIAMHPPGQSVRVYYDPADPTQAFIVRTIAFWPYGVTLFAAVLLWLFARPMLRGGSTVNAPVASQPAQGGWHQIAINRTPGASAQAAGLATVAWVLFGGALVGHYALLTSTTPESFGALPAVFAVAYAALGLAPLGHLVRCAKQMNRLGEATVATTLAEPKVDHPIVVKVEQPVRSDMARASVLVVLACYQRSGTSSQQLFLSSHELAHQQPLRAGQVVAGEHTFEVPTKKRRASTRWTRWTYPRIDWQLEVIVKAENAQYRTSYPIHLRPD